MSLPFDVFWQALFDKQFNAAHRITYRDQAQGKMGRSKSPPTTDR